MLQNLRNVSSLLMLEFPQFSCQDLKCCSFELKMHAIRMHTRTQQHIVVVNIINQSFILLLTSSELELH